MQYRSWCFSYQQSQKIFYESHVLLVAGNIQIWKVHKQAVHIVFATFQFIQRTKVHIIAQIPAWVCTYCDLMILAQFFHQFL